jgi:arginine deiminase
MSERSQARMIEQIAKNLFAKGAAERVIAAVMTKDRAHMHLDTVFTFLDRDVVTAYPKVVPNIRAISLRPGRLPGDFGVERENFSFYFPLATSIVVSIVISVLIWLFRK